MGRLFRRAMHRSLPLASLAALLALGLALAGCHEPGEPGGGAAPSFVYQSDDFSFDGPAELPAGWIHLVLEHGGMQPHHIQLYRLEDGHTMADLLSHLAETHAAPDWASAVGGPNPPVPGGRSEAWVHLEAGEHAMVCMIPDRDGTPHFAHGMAKAVRVVPDDGDAAPPESSLAVTLSDFAFATEPWTSGEHVVEVANEGSEAHELALVRYHEGAGFDALLAAFAPNATAPPPVDFLGGVSGIDSGQSQLFPVDLTPGQYGFVCFLESPTAGAPHFALGMHEEFTVE